jgi:alpha-tubulin suppressor-like RCC1 family protein
MGKRFKLHFIVLLLLAALIGLGIAYWAISAQRAAQDQVPLEAGRVPLAAGDSHTCALTNSGGVKCWGWNEYGQLGDGTIDATSPDPFQITPVDVSGLSEGVVAIAAGTEHTCALMDAAHGGGVKCWGRNHRGQLGDGTEMDRLTPVDVKGLSDVVAIAAGHLHTCALTRGGGVKCWGDNYYYGQLGDGTTTERHAPVDVHGLSEGVVAIGADYFHTCAVMDGVHGGGVKCWGNNEYGRLGDGTTENRSTPVDVKGLSGRVVAIAPGGYHTCALTGGGGVKCWGRNWVGQLGDGTTKDRLTPVDVKGLAGGVTAITAGDSHTCVLTSSGGVKCWGLNLGVQLGDGTKENRSTPVDAHIPPEGAVAITAGRDHNCALLAAAPADRVWCWGANHYGQCGPMWRGTTSNP